MTRHANCNPMRGFSLVELVMVIVIISVIAALAGPRFASAAARARAQAAADRVASDINLAQEQARATSATYMISFSPELDRYKLGYGSDDTSIRLDVAPYECDLVSASFDGSPTVQFNAFGIPNAGGTVVITGGGVTYTLKVNELTGEVTIQ